MSEVERTWADPSEDMMRRIFRVWRMSRTDLRLLWQALRHPNRPTWLLPATLALGFFAFEPFNFAIPVLGVIDDLFLLPLLLHGLAKIAVYVTTLPSTRSGDDRVVSVQ
jgi:uncharacterized membrane protein YkvA (DUF1232 family)